MLVKKSQKSESLEVDELRQEELDKLLKHYHILDGSKSISTIVNRKIMHRQMNELALLENEKRELQANYFLTQSVRNQMTDNKIIEEIKALLIIMERKDKEISDQIIKQNDIELKIAECEKLLGIYIKSNTNSQLPNQRISKNKVRNLESRLQKMINDYGILLTKNRNSKKNLSDLCFQQKKFESHRIKIAESILQCRSEIAQAIASSTSALESKDEYSTKTTYLKEKCDRDEKQHLAEMKELTRIIDHEKQLKKFMSDKTSERHDDSQMVAWRQEKVSRAVQKKLHEKDSLATLEESFKKITQLMETEDIEKIIKKFDEKEESNFALFKFVNEQNNKLDKYSNEIEEIDQETEQSKEKLDEMEMKRQSELTALESQLSRFEKVNSTYQSGIEKIDESTNIFIAEITKLFDSLDCEKNMPKNSFGEFDNITKMNVVQYMQAIEERLDHLIMINNYIHMKEHGGQKKLPFSFYKKKSMRLQQSPPILPSPDFLTEDDNISYYEIRPLSKKELQNKIQKKIHANFESKSTGNRKELLSRDRKKEQSSYEQVNEEPILVEGN